MANWKELIGDFLMPTILILLFFGAGVYLYSIAEVKETMATDTKIDAELFTTAKVAGLNMSEVKIFAYVDPKAISEVNSVEGINFPNNNTIVMGYDEAKMMISEKLFFKQGDEIKNLFGSDIIIGGILEMTKTPIDMMHFVSSEQYQKIDGQEIMFFKSRNKELKVFMTMTFNDLNSTKLKLTAKEGSLEEYKERADGLTPIIIGSEEARMMKEEKLFSNTGDIIKDFFGKDVIIVAVLEKTNSPIDMMHIVPLTVDQF